MKRGCSPFFWRHVCCFVFRRWLPYDYSIDGKYQARWNIEFNDGGFKTVDICGFPAVKRSQWNISGRQIPPIHMIMPGSSMNGQKIPSIGLSHGWQYDSFQRTPRASRAYQDLIVFHSMRLSGTDGRVLLCIEYTALLLKCFPYPNIFHSIKSILRSTHILEDKDGNRVEGLSYSVPSLFLMGEFTIDEADVQAYLAENGYVLGSAGSPIR